MEKQQLARNTVMSAIQVVITGIILFLLYRYLLKTIGVEQMGIWSVVLATSSAFRISELGLAGSVVKYVAKYIARADADKVSQVIQTAAISVAVFVCGLLIIAYPLLKWVLKLIMPAQTLQHALVILPYALVSLWIAAIAAVFQSGLDGCQRIDLRSFIMIISSALYLFLTMKLTPDYGLLGLAYAQVAQAGSLLVASWFMVRHELPALPLIPWRWSRTLFREMILYGVNFQIISITVMLFDPVTKALLSKFGSLSMVGYYEMANRMIMKLREIFVAATQVIVPVVAGLQEKSPERIRNVYRDTYSLLLCLSLPFYAGIIAAIPFISEIWIGFYEKTFVIFSIILTLGTFFNNLNVPAYCTYMGIGKLRWNILTNFATGVFNVLLGAMLGLFFGGTGVVVAWGLAWAIGSSVVIFAFHSEHSVPLSELFPMESRWLGIASIAGACLGFFVYYFLHKKMSASLLGTPCFLIFAAIVFPSLWFHPMRAQYLKWLANFGNPKSQIPNPK